MNNKKDLLIIKQAKKEDLEDIIEIEKICFPPAEAASSQSFHERFETFGENFLVAVLNGKVIGFINGATTDKPELPDILYSDSTLHLPNGDYQTVFGLDVLPDFRKNGIGAKLLDNLIDLSKKREKKGVILTCKDTKIKYYEKFGFKNQGVSVSSHGGAKWNDMLLEF